MNDEHDVSAEVAQHIRAYLAVNPAAMDSVRGIQEWWLRSLSPPPSEFDVRAALLHLEARGVAERIVNRDGIEVWRCGPRLSGREP